MIRSFCVLLALLLTFAAVAAPAPKTLPAALGKRADPDRDCKFRHDKGVLTIEMPGSDHDYDPRRNRFNAPRLVRDLEGNFGMEARVRIDCQPSAVSTVDREPSMVAGGFLIILPDQSCIRLEFFVDRQGGDAKSHAALRDQPAGFRKTNYVWDDRYDNWPLANKADHAFLKLERRGNRFYPSISADGEKWITWVGHMGIVGLPAKLKVGLAAYTSSTDSSKVRFDKIKFTGGKKK